MRHGPLPPTETFNQANPVGHALTDTLETLGFRVDLDEGFPEFAIEVAALLTSPKSYAMAVDLFELYGDSPDTKVLLALCEHLISPKSPWTEYDDTLLENAATYANLEPINYIWSVAAHAEVFEREQPDPLRQPEKDGGKLPEMATQGDEFRIAYIRHEGGAKEIQITRIIHELGSPYGRTHFRDIYFMVNARGEAIRVDQSPRGRIENDPRAKIIVIQPLLLLPIRDLVAMEDEEVRQKSTWLETIAPQMRIAIMSGTGDTSLETVAPEELSWAWRKYYIRGHRRK